MNAGKVSPVAGCPVAESFDPLAADYLRDPYKYLNELREEGPVHYVPAIGYWAVTRYEDVETIFGDPKTFSAAVAQAPLMELTEEAGAILKAGLGNVPVLSNFDPPGHTRVRVHLAKLLLPRRMEKLTPWIEARVSGLIDGFAADGHADIVDKLTFPLPALTMFSMLGFPEADAMQLKEWCEDKLEVNWGRPSPEYQLEAAKKMVLFWGYCERFVAERSADPKDDLTSDLIRQRKGDAEALDDREIASVIFALSFAGHETTTNLTSNVIYRLLSEPRLWDEVLADRSLVEGAVEETLRTDSSVIAWRRVTTKEVEIGGVTLPAGSKLMLGLGSANHDPRRFPEPDSFDPRRHDARAHLSFGKGTHFCLGQHLGRIEAKVVVGALADRLPGLRLVEGQEIEYPPNISFRGPRRLLVEWDAG